LGVSAALVATALKLPAAVTAVGQQESFAMGPGRKLALRHCNPRGLPAGAYFDEM
jgi:hypothetical protein